MRGPDRIGKYLVDGGLGAGSFATVWLAFDELLETRVAIKVLADNWSRSSDIRARFLAEARILRKIDHDRVVRVHDVDELPDGRPYFVMAWADGGTLHERIQGIRESGQLMPVAEALSLAIQARRRWEHRPHHRRCAPRPEAEQRVVPLRPQPRAGGGGPRGPADRRPSSDARRLRAGQGRRRRVPGFTLAAGTPAYMAPEQARASDNIDHRVDVFAAAAVLFELLTGTQAFDSGTLSGVRRREGSTTIPKLVDRRSGLDPALQTILQAGMATNRDQRTSSAAKLSDQLQEVLQRLNGPPTEPARGSGTLVGGAPSWLPPPPSASRPSLQPVGAVGRVKDLMMTARVVAPLPPEGLAQLEAVDEHLTRPLVVTAVTSGFPGVVQARRGRCRIRPAPATVAALARSIVTIRRGCGPSGSHRRRHRRGLTVGFDDNGDVTVTGLRRTDAAQRRPAPCDHRLARQA